MRQLITGISLLGSFVIFAVVVDLFDAMVMFLLFGILPGYQQQLSAGLMLNGYVCAATLLTAYSFRTKLPLAIRDLALAIHRLPRRISNVVGRRQYRLGPEL